MSADDVPPGLEDMLGFGLFEALLGRRSRRFPVGARTPPGALAYTSEHAPMPLSELEQLVVLSAVAGNTGWHHLIVGAERYAPHLASYAGRAGGRTFPSAAGFHTSELFFTDDHGVYLFETRAAPALVERDDRGRIDLGALLAAHRTRIRRIEPGRLALPRREPHIEPHNQWVANLDGTTLLFPVADVAQHMLLALCYLVQNGVCLYDDVHDEKIGGLDRFRHLVDVDDPMPLTYLEQLTLGEVAAESSAACFAGSLALQAMGLGGWMFDGIDRLSLLGASGDPEAPGLRFRFDAPEGQAWPNPTGREGVFEAACPPHVPDMRTAVEDVVRRKFGPGGPFHPGTPGPFRDTPRVRGAAAPHDEAFRDCVTCMADHILDRFGKFPGTIPSVYALMYLQAHHIDLGFYDTHFAPGSYLETHARHMQRWHPDQDSS